MDVMSEQTRFSEKCQTAFMRTLYVVTRPCLVISWRLSCSRDNLLPAVRSVIKPATCFLHDFHKILNTVPFTCYRLLTVDVKLSHSSSLQTFSGHFDVSTCKRFPYYWPFVRGITGEFPSNSSDVFFAVNKLLAAQSMFRCFKTPWRSCSVIVMSRDIDAAISSIVDIVWIK